MRAHWLPMMIVALIVRITSALGNLTHIELRYQYVIDPLLAILSAYAIDYLSTYMRHGSKIAPLPPEQFEVTPETV